MSKAAVKIKVDEQDGRWIAVAYFDDEERGETVVLTVGAGLTKADALADVKNDIPEAIAAHEVAA